MGSKGRGKPQNGAASASVSTEAMSSKDDQWLSLDDFEDEVKTDIFQLLKEANVKTITANIVKELEDFLNVGSFMKWMPEDGKKLGFDSKTRCNILSVIEERVKANTAEGNAGRPKAISTLIESSNTRSGKSYSAQYMQKANISTSIERDLNKAIDTYNIVKPTFEDYQSFFGYFNQNVKTSDNVPKYVWSHREEVFFTRKMLDHIQQHLLPNGYLCRGDYKLCEVMVPCHPNIHFHGRLDGIVCDTNDDDGSFPYIGIELKCRIGDRLRSQSILEFIGLIIKSRYPILHIETDMDSFKFMIHKENEANEFLSYQTESYDEAKAIIVNWIDYAKDYFNRHKRILLTEVNCIKKFSNQVIQSIKTPTSYVIDSAFIKKAKTKFDDGSDKLEKLNNLENAYFHCKNLKKLEFVSVKNRTGPVCKLQHENKLIVMKMCHFLAIDDDGNKIIDELKKESDVFEFLERAPKSDGLWPKLFYSGYIFNTNFYTIVTEFIEGRPPDSTSQVDFDKCLESLNKLHEVGILHGDPRPPNFIIETSSQKAYILDFGFSSILGKLNESEKKKDIKIMKRSFNIDIN